MANARKTLAFYIVIFSFLLVGHASRADNVGDLIASAQQAWQQGDLSQAYSLFEKASDLDPTKGSYAFAKYLLAEPQVKTTFRLVEKLLIRSAELQNPHAQFLLAKQYLDGEIVDFDLQAARYWIDLASMQGHNDALAFKKILQNQPLQEEWQLCESMQTGAIRQAWQLFTYPQLLQDSSLAISDDLLTCMVRFLNKEELFRLNTVHVRPTHESSSGRKAIHFAVLSNEQELVQWVVSLDVDINAKDDLGDTPLHYAVRLGNEAIVDVLLEYKPTLNLENNQYQTAFDFVADNRKIKNKLIQQGFKPGIAPAVPIKNTTMTGRVTESNSPYLGWPAQNVYAWTGEIEQVLILAKKGANMLALDTGQFNAMQRLLCAGYLSDLEKIKPFYSDWRLQSGDVQRMMSCNVSEDNIYVFVDAIMSLSANTIDWQSILEHQVTPLELALAIYDHPQNENKLRPTFGIALKKLKQATIEQANLLSKEISRLAFATLTKPQQLLILQEIIRIDSDKLLSALVETGFDFNQTLNSNGDQFIHLVARAGRPRVMQASMMYAHDIDQTNSEGNTALSIAALNDHAEIVSMLINKKSDIEHRNKVSFTPLMLAARANSAASASMLIGAGAVPARRDDKGRSSQEIAKQYKSEKVLALFN